MVLLRYLAVFFPALSAFLMFEVLFRFPQQVFLLLGVWLAIFVAAHIFLGRGEARTFAHWQFAIPSAVLVLSGAAYALFLESPLLRQGLALFLPFLVGVVFWNVYLFLYQPLRYQANSLEHLSLLANLLTMFFGVTSLFGLRLFLSIPAWTLALAVFVLSALLVQQSFWVSKISHIDAKPYLLLIPFVLMQFVVALMGLPVTHAVSGAATAIVYYIFLGMTRAILRKTYTPRAGLRYASIAVLGMALLFATAQWS
jgi:hypothetical protein